MFRFILGECAQGNSSARLVNDERGSSFIEYLLLVGMFGLVMGLAVYSIGGPLLKFYQHTQLIWAGPFP